MTETGYRGFRQEEMEYQYNPRESVPEYPQLAKKRAEEAAAAAERAARGRRVQPAHGPGVSTVEEDPARARRRAERPRLRGPHQGGDGARSHGLAGAWDITR